MKVLVGVALVLLGTLTFRAPAFALSCGVKLVVLGETKYEVAQKCGEPAHKEQHVEESRSIGIAQVGPASTTVVDVWTYDFGPQQFMQILTFRNAKLVDISQGSYGYAKGGKLDPSNCREGRLLRKDDTMAEVLFKCGEPANKEVRDAVSTSRVDDETVREKTVSIEEWTYDFGPDRFLYLVTFQNGSVVKIESHMSNR